MLSNGKIELIALDLDGTLLMENGRIHPDNIPPIREAVARGIPVVLATGKTPWSAQELIETLGLVSPGVFSQGMVITDVGGTVKRLVTLDKGVTTAVLDFTAARNLPVNVYAADGLYATMDDHYRHVLHTKYREPLPVLSPDLRHQLDTLQITKLLVSDEVNNDVTRADLERHLGDRAVVVQAVPEYIEILPLNVTKWTGLRWLLNEMGIDPAAVMAVGDGENDLDMLRSVGLGVAMGNASQAIKAAADVVVGSNEAAGVAEAIERFVLEIGH
ncbi:MAG: HAD family phosphatase [Ardenticatenaceae bacterium]|nr:HAD family phosphatase [Ardenticatenaceae bacterium]